MHILGNISSRVLGEAFAKDMRLKHDCQTEESEEEGNQEEAEEAYEQEQEMPPEEADPWEAEKEVAGWMHGEARQNQTIAHGGKARTTLARKRGRGEVVHCRARRGKTVPTKPRTLEKAASGSEVTNKTSKRGPRGETIMIRRRKLTVRLARSTSGLIGSS